MEIKEIYANDDALVGLSDAEGDAEKFSEYLADVLY